MAIAFLIGLAQGIAGEVLVEDVGGFEHGEHP